MVAVQVHLGGAEAGCHADRQRSQADHDQLSP
jgi:hypothetical protein